MSARTGIAIRTISKAKKILEQDGFLKISTTNNGFTRVSKIIPTEKLTQVFDFSDNAQNALSIVHDMHDRTSTECVTITHKMRDRTSTECVSDNAQNACKRNIERNIEKQSIETIRSVVGVEVCTDQFARAREDEQTTSETTEATEAEMGELSSPDYSSASNYTYNVQEATNSPQTTNYTQNANSTPSRSYTSEIEGNNTTRSLPNERTETTPQSADEVVPLIERFKTAHRSDKVFENIDVNFYATKIFDYYAREDGQWRDRNNNPIPPFKIYNKVSMWITNDQRVGRLSLKKTDSPMVNVNDAQYQKWMRDLVDQHDPAKRKQPIPMNFEVIDGKTREERELELEQVRKAMNWK